MSTATTVTSNVIEIQGVLPGDTSMVLAGVHGSETCGVHVLQRILCQLNIERGRVFFAFGNPRAIAEGLRKSRGGENLNRMFLEKRNIHDRSARCYEYQRAQYLKTWMLQSSVLLDIHASEVPDSPRFAICEPNARGIVEYLPVPYVVSGFDEHQPGGTDYWMNTNDKIGICVECGYLDDPASERAAEECLRAFLRVRGHMESDASLVGIPQQHFRAYTTYMANTDNLRLTERFADFAPIVAEQVIARDGDTEVVAGHDGTILFAQDAGDGIKTGDEGFVLCRHADPF